MKLLAEGTWDYMLFEHEGRLLLDVLCGSVAIFNVAIELTEEESALWETKGAAGLAPLVASVRGAPEQFRDRRVELPQYDPTARA